jgi:hypothetical protein
VTTVEIKTNCQRPLTLPAARLRNAHVAVGRFAFRAAPVAASGYGSSVSTVACGYGGSVSIVNMIADPARPVALAAHTGELRGVPPRGRPV